MQVIGRNPQRGRGRMLHFSQCTDGGMASQDPSGSQILSSALSGCRLGTPAPLLSLELTDSEEQHPLGDATNILEGPPCSQMHSQQLLSTQDFCTPVDPSEDEKPWQSFRTPMALSPSRAKRPRSLAHSDPDADMMFSQLSQPPPVPHFAAMGPPEAQTMRKVVRAVRTKSPPCLRNVFTGGSAAEDDEWNTSLRSLPKAQQPTSRYRADFKELDMLGQGNFSKVMRVKHRLDGMEYAVKRSLRQITADAAKRQWIQEVHAWATLPAHPNVVRYHMAWIEPADQGEHMYILLEKCGPSLAQHAVLETLSEAALLNVLRQVALALQHLHSHGMVHMDLKPDNVYLGTGDSDNVYKLGDFGLATQLKAAEVSLSEGDCRYVALEVMNDDARHLDKGDMFSLGAMLYELALGSPLPQNGPGFQAIRKGKLQLLTNFSTSFQNMLKALMAEKAIDRPSATKVLKSALLHKATAGRESGTHGSLNLQPSQQ